MNKTHLKRYAPKARKDIIAAVTQRAQLLGLSAGSSSDAGQVLAEPVQLQGDVVLIGGRPWPANVQGRRDALLRRMQRDGYAHTLEAVAYTWFNRLAALRYLELHDYLGHGRRVLSHPDGGLPEVLGHALALAEAGDLPGLTAGAVRELKLANQDGELYRRVLIAQCNALNLAMPFLFEAIADETELLLPDNLLLSDSIVAKLVDEIPEADWAEVEAIGWLYQFYISEKKDQVIGKVVKSEDIPAATQLFTPNWIVQYLVQNSVGRLWLTANPASTLASQWPYYIHPAEQTPEVQAQLDALIQIRIGEDGDSLNPETITVLDPACGSGHILVVAYDVLKAIYLERGYQPRAIPRLILEKNLYGLDIDDRAAQLAAFALLMKARADDRRLFADPPRLNVLSLQESKGLDLDQVAGHLAPHGLQRGELKALMDTFEHAKTFGSLIQIPAGLNGQLVVMAEGLRGAWREGDMYAQQAARDLLPLVCQGLVLGMQFDAVVANPPYMGINGMNAHIKNYVGNNFSNAKSDLFSAFISRGFALCNVSGAIGMVTMQNWMFLSSYQDFREQILSRRTISSLAQIGYNSFPEMNSKIAQACAFVILRESLDQYCGRYINLNSSDQSADKNTLFIRIQDDSVFARVQADFKAIQGSPIAYWVSEKILESFRLGARLGDTSPACRGLSTGNNEKFIRFWFEMDYDKLGIIDRKSNSSLQSKKWFPYNKGGAYRKWYGNNDLVVDWGANGRNIKSQAEKPNGDRGWRSTSRERYFQDGITWCGLTSSEISFRWSDYGAIFDTNKGPMMFPPSDPEIHLGFLSSKLISIYSALLNPTLSIQNSDIDSLPVLWGKLERKQVINSVREAVDISRRDWDSSELSWAFWGLNWLWDAASMTLLSNSWLSWERGKYNLIRKMKVLEEENNRLFIEAYNLQDEIAPEVPENQITLARADREKDCQRLISYAIGCMMGRYSLDETGLIYAHAGNVGFDPSRYARFPADADGILPLTDQSWFEDDAANRVREFLRAVWGTETLQENLAWLAESLGAKGSETPDETLRRYLADKFFKDHLQTYKKRPIYWLFSSGKQGAFQALVYLHRYHDGTLARMRNQYVVPLTAKLQTRIEGLQADVGAATSTAARTKLNKQLESLRRQQTELLTYDEKLRHFADQRISLDLDDGVKVNYGKFGDLLAEVKAITGGTED